MGLTRMIFFSLYKYAIKALVKENLKLKHEGWSVSEMTDAGERKLGEREREMEK